MYVDSLLLRKLHYSNSTTLSLLHYNLLLLVLILSMTTELSSTTTDALDLKTLLQPIYPTLQSVKLLGEPIVQASAIGYRCILQPENLQVFVKHVDAEKYCQTKSDWNDLRRALIYARTEVRFYQHFASGTDSSHMTPKIYHAQYNLDGLINENEHATDKSTRTTMPTIDECHNKGGLIVMELIHDNDYYQASPLTIEQCKQCLTAIATLHKSAWHSDKLLKRAINELSIPTFHLNLRNPKELAGIEDAWINFRTAFKHEFNKDLWERTKTLGTRLKENAVYISQQLDASTHQTLVHGDFKAMNAFLKKYCTNSAILVDFASCGVGNPMMDVAMHIHHAVMPNDLNSIKNLEDGGNIMTGEDELLHHYFDSVNLENYSYNTAIHDYKLAVVDYLRFFLGRMWKTATPETMKQKLNNPNINNINRYPSAAIAFIDRGEKYLTEIENERLRNKQHNNNLDNDNTSSTNDDEL